MNETTLFHGGTIVTMEKDQPEAEALVVRDGRIVAIGSATGDARRRRCRRRECRSRGRGAVPWFHRSARQHPMLAAQTVGDPVVDIRAIHTPTYDAVMEKICRRVAKGKGGRGRPGSPASTSNCTKARVSRRATSSTHSRLRSASRSRPRTLHAIYLERRRAAHLRDS